MPIPPRPIPTPAPRRVHPANAPTKPGSSLPRRGLHFMDHADMFDLPLPSSAPVKGLSGVSVVATKPEVKVKDEGRKTVVNVSDLITEGLGKREKRTTTATSLGFDFIQNPTILALPDDPATTAGRSVPTPTPRTPALEPSQAEEQEDDDDDWEHISGAHTREEGQGDEGDIILLGEFELEDAVAGAGLGTKEGKGKAAEVKSYAAVVGAAAARATTTQ